MITILNRSSRVLDSDIAIIIYSRSREAALSSLLDDLIYHYVPALEVGGHTCCIFVYAQGYRPDYLAGLEARHRRSVHDGKLILISASRTHVRIGDVALTAIRMVHERCRYTLAMLMDDDSSYTPDDLVAGDLASAARTFIDREHRAYSIKLGDSFSLRYDRFVEPAAPIMPFKEKMLWVRREVLDEVLAMERFSELSIGEDAVIAAVAWLRDPAACAAVYGMATFLHLGFERPEALTISDHEGGYATLVGYAGPSSNSGESGKYTAALATGVTPYSILPDVFVPPGHPHFEINGVRESVILRMGAGAPLPANHTRSTLVADGGVQDRPAIS